MRCTSEVAAQLFHIHLIGQYQLIFFKEKNQNLKTIFDTRFVELNLFRNYAEIKCILFII